jgi:hypothetical protein
MLFTHKGFSGPAVLDLSHQVALAQEGKPPGRQTPHFPTITRGASARRPVCRLDTPMATLIQQVHVGLQSVYLQGDQEGGDHVALGFICCSRLRPLRRHDPACRAAVHPSATVRMFDWAGHPGGPSSAGRWQC